MNLKTNRLNTRVVIVSSYCFDFVFLRSFEEQFCVRATIPVKSQNPYEIRNVSHEKPRAVSRFAKPKRFIRSSPRAFYGLPTRFSARNARVNSQQLRSEDAINWCLLPIILLSYYTVRVSCKTFHRVFRIKPTRINIRP